MGFRVIGCGVYRFKGLGFMGRLLMVSGILAVSILARAAFSEFHPIPKSCRGFRV